MFLRELRDVVEAADERTVKVILETCLLTRQEKVNACQLVVDAGAQFVKTSTGFSTAGATIDDVKLLREVVGKKFGVKAAGRHTRHTNRVGHDRSRRRSPGDLGKRRDCSAAYRPEPVHRQRELEDASA